MVQATTIKSLTRKSLWPIAIVAFAISIVSIVFIAKSIYSKGENTVINQSAQLVRLVAIQQFEALKNNNKYRAQNNLQVLDYIPSIEQVDVYKTDTNAELILFAQYKRQIRDAVANLTRQASQEFKQEENFNLKDIKKYRVPTRKGTSVLVSYPVSSNNELGYVVMRSNLSIAHTTSQRLVIIITSFIILILICVLSLVYIKLQQIAKPLDALSDFISEISHQKNFNVKCPKGAYQEIDWLMQQINLFLARINKHISKLTEVETQIKSLNLSLEDKVTQRTEALKQSNQELLSTLEKLHQYQGQLVESEKMASLGDMVAGVAHEINTPIGLGITASTLLSDNIDELKKAHEEKTLKSSQFKQFITNSQENISIIYRNLSRAADLIANFKKMAVDQSTDEVVTFNVYQLIIDVKLTLAPQFHNTAYQLTIHCPENLVITSKPGPLNQILVNLIVNSIIHGFENREHGEIIITVNELNGQLILHYADDGVGIDDSIKNKIFEPFITTKRGSGGSGLGLHLVYNLVTQALSGSINVSHKSDHGVIFDINFPIHND